MMQKLNSELQNRPTEHFYHRKMQNMTFGDIALCRTCTYWQMQKSRKRLIKAQIKWNLLKKDNTQSGVRKVA